MLACRGRPSHTTTTITSRACAMLPHQSFKHKQLLKQDQRPAQEALRQQHLERAAKHQAAQAKAQKAQQKA